MPSEKAAEIDIVLKAPQIDIVFLAANRPEFTAWSLEALAKNTDWSLVRRLIIYTDGVPMRVGFTPLPPIPFDVIEFNHEAVGGPVAIMNHYLAGFQADQYPFSPATADLWAKIDNDVIVPPGWLEECVDVMARYPELDLLGIEPPLSRTRAPWRPRTATVVVPEECHELTAGGWPVYNHTFAKTDSIGGIGLFRRRAWENRPGMQPFSTYGGFTDWQITQGKAHAGPGKPLVIGWKVPPLKLFLLDRMPMHPYSDLNELYLRTHQQRPWTLYSEETARELAGWWLDR
jgi:hypothetical protein